MLIRPAYPDEIGRAQSLLNGHPVPQEARFLVAVKEQPVERIIATIPWWKAPNDDDEIDLKFSIHSGNSPGLPEAELAELFTTLEDYAQEEKASTLTADIPLVAEHPLFQKLTARGYQISHTETIITAAGDEMKSFFLAQENKLPSHWNIESIRGRSPEPLHPLIAAEGSLTPKTFKSHWDGSNRERYEQDFSHLITSGEEVIGLLLVTLRVGNFLNFQIESISPSHLAQAALISNALHQAAFQKCPENFPKFISWNRQTKSAYQGGQAQKARHTLSLKIGDSREGDDT